MTQPLKHLEKNHQKPRCIALVNRNTGWGGGEKYMLQIAQSLQKRGHKLMLVAAQNSALAEAFRKEACKEVVYLEQLQEALPRFAPTVALCNARKDILLMNQHIKRLKQPPRLALQRGIARPMNGGWWRRSCWGKLSHIIANSDATANMVRSSLPWFPEERISRIYLAVPFEPKPHISSLHGEWRIGTASRLVPSKAVDVLLKALAALPEELNWTCTIAGEGKARPALEKEAQDLGISNRCIFLGHVQDMASFYAALDVMVIPSLYEGFCLSAVEAALAGLPVIASGVTALKEVVIDEKTGILVPPKSPHALTAALQQLATNPAYAQTLGQQGADIAKKRFATEALMNEMERTLIQVANEPPVGWWGHL